MQKIDNKYYYLIGPQEDHSYLRGIECYQQEFDDEIKKFKNVIKEDYTSYHESECVLGNLYFKHYLIKKALGLI